MGDVWIGDLVRFGWTARVSALFEDVRDPFEQAGRVVRVERTRVIVVTGDGRERAAAAPAPLAVGDWVALSDGVVQAVLPRWSELSRQDPNGERVQVLAANVDLVIIVVPADRVSAARVERELAIAWESSARPVVVLSKDDVAATGALAELADRLIGVEVLATSSLTGAGVEAIAELLRPDRTAVLLGPSGAGKSTLANALAGNERLATGAVREGDHRGRHTTTSRQLIALPGGGVLIDTPGLRSLGLIGDTIEQVFPEIERLSSSCRFSDCRHEREPGCAVNAALESGELDAERFASFQRLELEVADAAERSNVARRARDKVRNQRVRPIESADRRRSD